MKTQVRIQIKAFLACLLFAFSVNAMYYFDGMGNSGIFPVMLDSNFGFNL